MKLIHNLNECIGQPLPDRFDDRLRNPAVISLGNAAGNAAHGIAVAAQGNCQPDIFGRNLLKQFRNRADLKLHLQSQRLKPCRR